MTNVINVQPWLKFTATTIGRDQVYRTVQYFSRFLAWYVTRQGLSRETVARFNRLKKTLGLSRKLMRIGKPIEHLESAVAARSLKNELLLFCTVGKQLSYAGYLTYDALIFLDGAGAYKFKNIERYNELANKFWLSGIVFSLFTGLYKTRQILIRREAAARDEKSYAQTELKTLTKQLLQDTLDALIPSSSLGYVDLDDGIVGLIGTSIMGAQTQWAKVNTVGKA
ncbi:Peroxisomal membrane protein PMP27 [Modicella reniformis]|uniref:Peroxisomal membrane protein PMP27 n=1 Tax=Modicella reniformis TaxID=1440133 RepID=A0A9P6MAI2_9FUNG|nr:Peroxisomal membrane protein PMP27 [Modicella reniformis]